MIIPPNDFMRIPEASAYLHIGKQALANLRYLGKGPRYMAPTPRTILYRQTWLDEWLVASERTGTAA